ncbi:MAG: succinate dehydrogenase cytochrome b subunit [Fibromonadales bacterium]|nr:succinate dehydrogenase cytochrome b subunit [Fibromonadales bacterium]
MKWLFTYLTSSIGKKQVMGASGCLIALFVLIHVVGNLQLLLPDAEKAQAAYNLYTALLTKSKLVLYSFEAGMVVLFIVHIYLAITLKLQNYKARGAARYVVDDRKGKKQFPTFIMIWSGLTVLAFLVWHLVTFRSGSYSYYYYVNPELMDGIVVRDMWLTVVEMLGDTVSAVLFLSAILAVGFHLWHAISSAIQTMGINHPKWTPIINKLALAYCVAITLGFGAAIAGTWATVNMDLFNTKATIEKSKDSNYQSFLERLSEQPVEDQKAFTKRKSFRGGPDFSGKKYRFGGEGRGKGEGRGPHYRKGESIEESQNPEELGEGGEQ